MHDILQFPLFKLLNLKEKQILLKNSADVYYKPGETIFKKGTFNHSINVLLNGFVKIYIEQDDKIRILDISKPGWIIALLYIFDSESYNVTAEAITDCKITMINKSVIEKFIKYNSKFTLKLLDMQGKIADRYIRFLAFQNQKNVRGRVAEILIYLCDFVFQSNDFPKIFTSKEIAAFANTTTETAIRIMNELKSEKIIDYTKSQIKILNKDFLLRYIKTG
ncbi:MAG: Crp/Fnr family transcriptional regulator [Marinilabiliales bacterium]